MNILIVGAGGFIGGRLARRFMVAGDQVVACGRNPEKLRRAFPGLKVVAADYNQDGVEAWLPRLQGVEVVINAAGVIGDRSGNRMHAVHATGPRALFQACLQAGVRRVIQISALGADPTGSTRYYRSKGEADAFLASLDPPRENLWWSVVRPSVVIGRGGGSTGLFSTMAAFPLMPRLGKGTWRVQPIHVNDLTGMVFTLTRMQEKPPAWIEATGPTPMTTDALTTAFRNWLGVPGGRFVPVPAPLLRLAGRVGDLLPMGPLNSEALSMLMGDNLRSSPSPAPNDPLAASPVPEALAMEPATRADLWEARLEPMRLPLRWGLGIFWLLAGALPLLVAATRVEGYTLLARMGAEGGWADLLLFGSAGLDILLGAMLLIPFQPRLAGGIQMVVTLLYSALILAFLPEYLTHPFGPWTKNLPLLVATGVMMVLEE